LLTASETLSTVVCLLVLLRMLDCLFSYLILMSSTIDRSCSTRISWPSKSADLCSIYSRRFLTSCSCSKIFGLTTALLFPSSDELLDSDCSGLGCSDRCWLFFLEPIAGSRVVVLDSSTALTDSSCCDLNFFATEFVVR
jgi:hypothetical protein